MKKIISKIYFSFLLLLTIGLLFSIIFKYNLKDKIYYNYFPEKIIIPQYDLITHEVTNKEEVNFWKASDYAPWYGVISYKFYRFTKSNGILFYLFSLLFFLPVFFSSRKKISWIHWAIVISILVINFFLLGLLNPP